MELYDWKSCFSSNNVTELCKITKKGYCIRNVPAENRVSGAASAEITDTMRNTGKKDE